jgi:IS1 family transposase
VRKLSTDKRAAILSALVEGSSINATARMCGCSKITVLRLLADAGAFCAEYHNENVRNVHAERVQMDEIWSFVGCKDRAKKHGSEGEGSVWTWIAIDAESKLVINYMVGQRDQDTANAFVADTADRVDSYIQLTSDGFRAYVEAVELAFGGYVDYARLIKVYGRDVEAETRYSPPVVVECYCERRAGRPNPAHISTSYVERQNLTLRMGSRRFTRLTNAYSKRLENHCHAIALHYFHYNFIRKHHTIKTTPAVAMGLASKPWTVRDLVEAIEVEEKRIGGRLTDYLPACSK